MTRALETPGSPRNAQARSGHPLRRAFRRLVHSPDALLSLGVVAAASALTYLALTADADVEDLGDEGVRARARVVQPRVIDQLQRALINRDLPELPRTTMHGRYLPAAREAHVGGDWYDAFPLEDGRLFFSIGDVAGHGIEAAGHMVATRQAILVAALQSRDPARALAFANRAVVLQHGPMVTAICGFIDAARGQLEYATAGHPPMLLIDADNPGFLPYDGLALGVDPQAAYITFRQPLNAGSMLVMYTDGLIEYKRDVFAATDRLLRAGLEAARDDDPAAVIEQIMFADSRPVDDVAILTISVGAPELEYRNGQTNGLHAVRD